MNVQIQISRCGVSGVKVDLLLFVQDHLEPTSNSQALTRTGWVPRVPRVGKDLSRALNCCYVICARVHTGDRFPPRETCPGDVPYYPGPARSLGFCCVVPGHGEEPQPETAAGITLWVLL